MREGQSCVSCTPPGSPYVYRPLSQCLVSHFARRLSYHITQVYGSLVSLAPACELNCTDLLQRYSCTPGKIASHLFCWPDLWAHNPFSKNGSLRNQFSSRVYCAIMMPFMSPADALLRAPPSSGIAKVWVREDQNLAQVYSLNYSILQAFRRRQEVQDNLGDDK